MTERGYKILIAIIRWALFIGAFELFRASIGFPAGSLKGWEFIGGIVLIFLWHLVSDHWDLN